LRTIINGTHDAFIRSWAIAAKQWGHPFFLRFDAEQNGDWYPWSEIRNGNTAGQFVQAWKHVHDIFTQAGATNVTWVWCPNIMYAGATPLAELYPGDRYVDWVAMDGYNYGTTPSNDVGWKSFYDLFKPTYDELQTLAPEKPVMIAETASTEDGGSKTAWITDALTVQLPTNFPNIKAFLWYNANDADTGLVIETSASAQAAFAAGIASAYYASNIFGTLTTSPISSITTGDAGTYPSCQRCCAATLRVRQDERRSVPTQPFPTPAPTRPGTLAPDLWWNQGISKCCSVNCDTV
jgi:hypothetical protein